MYERERMSEAKHENVTAALLSFSAFPSLFCPQPVQEPRYFLPSLSQSVSCLCPKHPLAQGCRGCVQCPAIDAGSLMHSLHLCCKLQGWSSSQSLVQLQPGSSPPPPGSHWLLPLALDCKDEDQHKGKHGNTIPVCSLPCSSLLLLFSMLRTARLGQRGGSGLWLSPAVPGQWKRVAVLQGFELFPTGSLHSEL